MKEGSYLMIIDWGEYLKKQNGENNVSFFIKVEDNTNLHSLSKKLVGYFKAQKHSQFSLPTKEEEKLMHATEKAVAAKEEK